MKCIVGLGNPGNRYRFSRHNIGFLVAEMLSDKIKSQPFESNELYECNKGLVGDCDVLIVQPQTYMNNSGTAVRELKQKYEIGFDDFMIVFDDFQLPYGTLRMRTKGSDGGHNGMASVIYHLQSDLIPRLRIGVAGRSIPEQHTHDAMADYVLARFEPDEEKLLPQLLQHTTDVLICWVNEGIAKTMSVYNKNFFTPGNSAG
ncbi:MAG: aminoacyl-tRNA hydrolase [Bacteroidota bacterium]